MKAPHIHTASLGLVALGLAAGSSFMLVNHNGWSEVTARVQSVAMTCIMHPMHAGIGDTSPEVNCADAEAFRRQHAAREWIVNERFAAIVSMPSGTTSVAAKIELQRLDGVAPKAGDTLTVIQNPSDPTQVAAAGRTGLMLTVATGGALIGAIMLLATFRRPKPTRKDMEIAVQRASVELRDATAAAVATKARRALFTERKAEGPVFGKR